MYRIIVAMVFAFGMVVGVIGSSPTQSLARQESATPVPTLPTELCTDDQINTWEGEVTVSPSQADDARVQPLDSPDRYLYLVVWTIPPGTCVPYSAGGNMKDGGVVLIVQQGTIEFTAKQFDAGSAAE